MLWFWIIRVADYFLLLSFGLKTYKFRDFYFCIFIKREKKTFTIWRLASFEHFSNTYLKSKHNPFFVQRDAHAVYHDGIWTTVLINNISMYIIIHRMSWITCHHPPSILLNFSIPFTDVHLIHRNILDQVTGYKFKSKFIVDLFQYFKPW